MFFRVFKALLVSGSLVAASPVFGQDAGAVSAPPPDESRNLVLDAIKSSGEMIKKAAEYSKSKADKVWDKTRDVSGKTWQATKEVIDDGEHAVKEGYEVIKDKVSDPLNAVN